MVFPHHLEYNLQSTEAINEIFSLAPAAGPAIVKIGYNVACMHAAHKARGYSSTH